MATNKNIMYDQYYTAADSMVVLYYAPTDRYIVLDKAVGVGFKHEISSAPVYGLGQSDPMFFSRGNSLGQGQLDLAFKSDVYMQKALNYLFDNTAVDDRINKIKEANPDLTKMSDADFKEYVALSAVRPQSMSTKSLMSIPDLVEVQITLNNSNSNHTDGNTVQDVKTYKLYGVKFTEEVIGINSADDGVIHDTYRFMFKNLI